MNKKKINFASAKLNGGNNAIINKKKSKKQKTWQHMEREFAYSECANRNPYRVLSPNNAYILAYRRVRSSFVDSKTLFILAENSTVRLRTTITECVRLMNLYKKNFLTIDLLYLAMNNLSLSKNYGTKLIRRHWIRNRPIIRTIVKRTLHRDINDFILDDIVKNSSRRRLLMLLFVFSRCRDIRPFIRIVYRKIYHHHLHHNRRRRKRESPLLLSSTTIYNGPILDIERAKYFLIITKLLNYEDERIFEHIRRSPSSANIARYLINYLHRSLTNNTTTTNNNNNNNNNKINSVRCNNYYYNYNHINKNNNNDRFKTVALKRIAVRSINALLDNRYVDMSDSPDVCDVIVSILESIMWTATVRRYGKFRCPDYIYYNSNSSSNNNNNNNNIISNNYKNYKYIIDDFDVRKKCALVTSKLFVRWRVGTVLKRRLYRGLNKSRPTAQMLYSGIWLMRYGVEPILLWKYFVPIIERYVNNTLFDRHHPFITNRHRYRSTRNNNSIQFGLVQLRFNNNNCNFLLLSSLLRNKLLTEALLSLITVLYKSLPNAERLRRINERQFVRLDACLNNLLGDAFYPIRSLIIKQQLAEERPVRRRRFNYDHLKKNNDSINNVRFMRNVTSLDHAYARKYIEPSSYYYYYYYTDYDYDMDDSIVDRRQKKFDRSYGNITNNDRYYYYYYRYDYNEFWWLRVNDERLKYYFDIPSTFKIGFYRRRRPILINVVKRIYYADPKQLRCTGGTRIHFKSSSTSTPKRWPPIKMTVRTSKKIQIRQRLSSFLFAAAVINPSKMSPGTVASIRNRACFLAALMRRCIINKRNNNNNTNNSNRNNNNYNYNKNNHNNNNNKNIYNKNNNNKNNYNNNKNNNNTSTMYERTITEDKRKAIVNRLLNEMSSQRKRLYANVTDGRLRQLKSRRSASVGNLCDVL